MSTVHPDGVGGRAIDFSANYCRYRPRSLALLMRIAEALGAIRGARVLPAVADQLRATVIEGNELPLVAAQRAARHELDTGTRAKIELVNYVDAPDLIDGRVADGTLELTPELLRTLHATAMRGLGRDDRISGRVMVEGPPKDGVPARMAGVFDWLERKLTTDAEQPFVLAGVMHYSITDVHPFADGNGRAARLFQTAVLMKLDVLPGRMFSFEGYYATDRAAYYDALRSVRLRTLNMEVWLEYFLGSMAEEYERVAGAIDDLGSLLSMVGGHPLRVSALGEPPRTMTSRNSRDMAS